MAQRQWVSSKQWVGPVVWKRQTWPTTADVTLIGLRPTAVACGPHRGRCVNGTGLRATVASANKVSSVYAYRVLARPATEVSKLLRK